MKAIIITGASRGMGRAMFELLADRRDTFVISIVRRATSGQEDVPNAVTIVRDFSDCTPASLGIDAQLGDRRFSEIVFINNAGTIDPISKLADCSPESIVSAFATNAIWPVLLAREVFSAALARGVHVRLVNVTSGAAVRPIAGWSMYCATKAAARIFFETVASEYPDASVHQIDPGVVDTDMQRRIRSATVDEFPQRDRFRSLHEDGRLISPAVAAANVLRQASLL